MDKVKFLERQYTRNHSRIVGLCYRYVNDFTVAEDLAQDVFLKAMENLTAPQAIFNFDHWLTRIAVNHCIDHLRQQPDFVLLPLESVADSVSVESRDARPCVSTVDFTEKEILETIQQLPELQRAVFNLYAIERYSHRRIAGMLGISVDNSKQLHHRARVRLAKMLTDKQKEKDDKKKGLIMALLFFSQIRTYANGRRIDRLYRSKLSGLRIDPTVVGANNDSPLREEPAPLQEEIALIPVVRANDYSPLQTEPTNVPVSDTLPEPPSVTKTIVIRDTVTVHDTILKMQDYD